MVVVGGQADEPLVQDEDSRQGVGADGLPQREAASARRLTHRQQARDRVAVVAAIAAAAAAVTAAAVAPLASAATSAAAAAAATAAAAAVIEDAVAGDVSGGEQRRQQAPEELRGDRGVDLHVRCSSFSFFFIFSFFIFPQLPPFFCRAGSDWSLAKDAPHGAGRAAEARHEGRRARAHRLAAGQKHHHGGPAGVGVDDARKEAEGRLELALEGAQ